ncbi:uncharacterized protein Nmag_1380 [Natrialba magadii ATCC 43099]|uniref:Uncharacterized protein n=1 Tax=Natrialba magadii (strain ATCC 43099 / DSM 3394 / CCM 3739 / CIP 104546 / IAM 13178 / JCM 8861 / NBRC 102185 / NCIMB 2190 / MS3) TaxID=547559 RepID=D3ST13_NATMM|nr:hypothetical protein [Natrialba magadii]ADD04959.1 uncharacterized protein Nmag_1380 [Natrialba magadii ATCC 43099]ELY24007.1 hypothetical protein C500_19425 [Natrialba magadii ATCC 43099]
MNNATPVLLALLLVCSLPAISIVAASPSHGASGDVDEQQSLQQSTTAQEPSSPVEIENTSNQLPLTGDIRGSHTVSESNLGTSFAKTTTQLQVDQQQYVLTERDLDELDGEDREQRIQTAYENTKDQIDALETREREAVLAHQNGDLSDGELVQVLVENYYEASALEETLFALQNDDDIDVVPSQRQQFRADRTLLEFQTTAIRETLAEANEAGNPNTSYEFRIQTSESGYRLSALDGDTYSTETVRFDNRDADAPNRYESIDQMIEDITAQYPWAHDHGSPHYQDNSLENLYWVDLPHDNGQLDIYVDAGTGDVYREAQEVSVESLPTVETETKSTGRIERTFDKTPSIGPTVLTVTEDGSDEPLQATIRVDGREIGATDENGSITYLPPADSYNITIDGETESVSAPVSNG